MFQHCTCTSQSHHGLEDSLGSRRATTCCQQEDLGDLHNGTLKRHIFETLVNIVEAHFYLNYKLYFLLYVVHLWLKRVHIFGYFKQVWNMMLSSFIVSVDSVDLKNQWKKLLSQWWWSLMLWLVTSPTKIAIYFTHSIVIKKSTFDRFNFHMLMKTITHLDMHQKMKKYN